MSQAVRCNSSGAPDSARVTSVTEKKETQYLISGVKRVWRGAGGGKLHITSPYVPGYYSTPPNVWFTAQRRTFPNTELIPGCARSSHRVIVAVPLKMG
jgi:hypothetical protein